MWLDVVIWLLHMKIMSDCSFMISADIFLFVGRGQEVYRFCIVIGMGTYIQKVFFIIIK